MSRTALVAFAAANVAAVGCGGEARVHDTNSESGGGSNGGGPPIETGGYIPMVFYGAPMIYTGGAPGTGGIPNASGGAPGTGGDPNVADGGLNCQDEFSGGTPSRCCAKTPPDCTNKPDGYPGFGCTPGKQSFCSCNCSGGTWICGC
jgi:hypothetical protein